MSKKLTDQELAYRTARVRGNKPTAAARIVGIKHPNKKAYLLEKKPAIRAAIEAHQAVDLDHALLTRNERRGLFAKTVRDEGIDIPHRLMAAKLDGMCEGDFVQRLEIKSPQIEKLLGQVISILRRTLSADLLLVVAKEFAMVRDTYGLGNNDAELS